MVLLQQGDTPTHGLVYSKLILFPFCLLLLYLKISNKEDYDFETSTIKSKINDTMEPYIMSAHFIIKIN